MQRGVLAGVLVVVAVAAGCSSSAGTVDEVGATCPVEPNAVCRDQDLQSVSLAAADLRGADFSGSNLTSSDFTEADLRGAKFVGSDLSGATFAGANLAGADLSKSTLYYTNFTDADLDGVIKTGIFDCFSVQPDGSIGTCPPTSSGTATTTSTRPAISVAPVINYFRLERPGKCVYDAEGTGIDVEWSVRNATSVVFSIDGIRVDSQSKARGSLRLPFICDGKPHVATLEAFGPIPPAATASITKSLDETAPQPPVG